LDKLIFLEGLSSILGIMRILSPPLVSKPMAIVIANVAAIVVILFAANVTITNAQDEQQQVMNNSRPTELQQNGTLFENRQDSFRVQVPQGWAIYDINNTGSVLAAELTQGYTIIAQLCPEGQQGQVQQRGAFNTSGTSCRQEEEVIHIIKYPNLGANLGIGFQNINNTVPDSVLQYEIQKLQDVGYRDINIINSTNTTLKVHYLNDTAAEGLGITEPATVPARFVEITYSTGSAPNEIRRGFLILTATNATPPNVQTVTGYSIFYEGVRAPASESLAQLPAAVRQIFDSFELIPSDEVRTSIVENIVSQLVNNNNNGAEDANADEESGDGDEDDTDE
jgi:hypothetical protein